MLTALLLLLIIAAGAFVVLRMQRDKAAGLSTPVRAAARRLGYVADRNRAAVANVNSPELCTTAMAYAFARMDTTQQLSDNQLATITQKRLGSTAPEAADMTTLAQWLVAQSGGPTPAFQDLTKRLKQLDHGTEFDKLMRVLGDVTAAGTKGMPSPPQADALGALARVFRTA